MKPELLAPAGNWESLTAGVEAGCDAVYLGTKLLNMRATANNFELTELKKVVDYCHKNKVKVFVTLNTIVFDNEFEQVDKVLEAVKESKADAVICWDMGVMKRALKYDFEVHISTQMSVANSEAIKFFEDLGISRIVLARELTLEQIKNLKTKIIKECFAHGAMCVAESGRCFTSQFLSGRSANRGDCLQPCRRRYNVRDVETGDELELENNYVMSPKDLCTLPILDKLVDAGIRSFKIEGRARSPEYVKTVIECYREALDSIKNKKFDKKLANKLMKKLESVYNRKFSSGFYLGTPTADDFTDIHGSAATKKKIYAGRIKHFYDKVMVADILIESCELNINDNILVIGPTTGVIEQKADSMQINNKDVEKVEKGKHVGLKLNKKARKNDKVFILQNN